MCNFIILLWIAYAWLFNRVWYYFSQCMHDIILEKLNIGPIARFYKWMLFSGLAHNFYCPSLNNLIFPFWFELRNSIHNDLNHEFYSPFGVLFIDSLKYIVHSLIFIISSLMRGSIWLLDPTISYFNNKS